MPIRHTSIKVSSSQCQNILLIWIYYSVLFIALLCFYFALTQCFISCLDLVTSQVLLVNISLSPMHTVQPVIFPTHAQVILLTCTYISHSSQMHSQCTVSAQHLLILFSSLSFVLVQYLSKGFATAILTNLSTNFPQSLELYFFVILRHLNLRKRP